ncbi:hypothetical protein L6452_04895 [Arctium lappa]|uniref:Uncharacterized protein n=1 Tax=Arctium lappa TaxID=4217 RepID=A0ACB9EEG4_ARCLA|nr:hypothetical protein L6452_04895 [Arctium lappa]
MNTKPIEIQNDPLARCFVPLYATGLCQLSKKVMLHSWNKNEGQNKMWPHKCLQEKLLIDICNFPFMGSQIILISLLFIRFLEIPIKVESSCQLFNVFPLENDSFSSHMSDKKETRDKLALQRNTNTCPQLSL